MSSKLDGLAPALQAKVTILIGAMADLGFRMVVTDGIRTDAQQIALYAQGRTATGVVVTHCDGVQLRSRHQPQADSWGHAVDCTFTVDGKPDWAEAHPWRLYGEMGKALGLKWGGDWTIPDRPHLELP